jgi:transposase
VSKARLVITAVVVEGRSQSEVARAYGVWQSWISRLVARYRLEGEAAFTPRSRRPHTSPHRLPQTTIELVIELREKLASKGLDHGPHTIAWHLQHHHGLTVSVNSIHRHLRAAGLVTPTPQRRPKSSYIRFAAEQPNERWQADFTHWWLADHTHVEILNWIDDHARYALSVTAHHRVTGPIVLAEFRKTVAAHGVPASTLTDNGMVFTTRLSGGKGPAGPSGFYVPGGKPWADDSAAPMMYETEQYRFRISGEDYTGYTRMVGGQQQQWVQYTYDAQRYTQVNVGAQAWAPKGPNEITGELGGIVTGGMGGATPPPKIEAWRPMSLQEIAVRSAQSPAATYYIPDGCGGKFNFQGGVPVGGIAPPPTIPSMIAEP